MSERRFVPLPFPGAPADGLLSGITPPADSAGRGLDLRDPAPLAGDLQRCFDAPGWPVYWITQVHGRDVVRVAGQEAGLLAGTADALISDRSGVLLLVRQGDCPPVLLWDPVRRAVGLAHSGRRGTLRDVAGATVAAMSESFRSRPRDLIAAVGPGIRTCCYQVREDVLREVPGGEGSELVTRREGGFYLDLRAMIARQLLAAGVRDVSADPECTCCGPSRMHSYRRGGTRSRFAAVAGVAPGTPRSESDLGSARS